MNGFNFSLVDQPTVPLNISILRLLIRLDIRSNYAVIYDYASEDYIAGNPHL